MPSALPARFYVYVLLCADGSFYVGHTRDIQGRVELHNQGRAALWIACRRPVKLFHQEVHYSEAKAVARERQIKGWTHSKKRSLGNGDLVKLKALAKRRIR